MALVDGTVRRVILRYAQNDKETWVCCLQANAQCSKPFPTLVAFFSFRLTVALAEMSLSA